jgi:hypothetical protein
MFFAVLNSLNAAVPLAHLVLTGASTDKAKSELTDILQWSLETLYSWFPRLHITRIMTDRCPAHINAFARTESKLHISALVYTIHVLQRIACMLLPQLRD